MVLPGACRGQQRSETGGSLSRFQQPGVRLLNHCSCFLQSGTLPVVPPVKSSLASPETVLSGPGAASKMFKAVPGVTEKSPGGFQSIMCVSVCFSQSEASISLGPVFGPNMAAAASSVPKHGHNPTRGGGGRSGSGFSAGLILEAVGGVGMGGFGTRAGWGLVRFSPLTAFFLLSAGTSSSGVFTAGQLVLPLRH